MSDHAATVKRAFPDSEWDWWTIANPNGTTSYFALVYTASRTVLGQAMDHNLNKAQEKAYRKAAKHPYVTGWLARLEAE